VVGASVVEGGSVDNGLSVVVIFKAAVDEYGATVVVVAGMVKLKTNGVNTS
jgi:hypothetical protein